MSEGQQIAQQTAFDHDGFWKDLIGRFWKGLLKRALPDLYDAVDFTKKPRFLDKELTDTLQTMESKEHFPPRRKGLLDFFELEQYETRISYH